MSNYDTLGMIKQRLEILYQLVNELESGGGGGGGGTTNYNDLSNKPAIEGQQLVGNKTASDLGLATTSQLNGKVDKVEGSSLMTSAQATKLEGIEAGAEVNVQADWNQANSSADDYIKNKPTLGTAAERGVDTVPTDDSTNLITSGAVYDAIQGGGGGTSFFPEVITYEKQSFQNYIPADKFSIIQDHAPYSVYDDGWPTNFYLAETNSSYVYIGFGSVYNPIENGSISFNLIEINKTSRKVETVNPGGGRGFTTINDKNLINQFYNGYFNSNGGVPEFPSDLNTVGISFGLYKKSSTGSVTNCPTTEIALMEYNSFAGANQRIQKIYTVSGTPTVYIRIFDSTVWSSWYKFEGTIVT